MLNGDTKRKIQGARDILVGKIPVPTAQVEQITLALMYKFMSDMDEQAKKLGDKTGFFMGEYEKYSWNKITDTSLSAYDRVALYSEGLEKMNNNPNVPQLFRDIFKGAFLPFKDPETLKLFLDQINEIEYTHSEDLGDAYEYLLSVMGSQGDAGQFRTPRHIIDFIVEIVDPKKEDKILDPACGTAGFLISAYKHILRHNTTKDSKILGDALSPMDRRNLTRNFVGYDISHEMRRLSLVNMYLHQFPDPQIYEYDTLTSTDHWDEDFDCILANPPFMTPKGGIRPHKRFAIQANKAEVLFVDYIMEHLSTSGKAGIIVPEGIIFQSSNAYKNLRKLLVEDNYLWGVISLPQGVFNPYSGVKTSILLLDKNIAKKTDKMLFVNVDGDGFDLGAQRKENGKNDLPMILESLKKYKEWALNDEEIKEDELFSINIVGKSRIKESGDYNLGGNLYQSSERGVYIKGKWEEASLGDLIKFLKKSQRKSGDGEEEGIYNFYVSSQSLIKKCDFADYTEEALILGTGGAPSVHISKDFSCSADTFVIKSSSEKLNNKFLYFLLRFKEDLLWGGFRGSGLKHLSKEYLNNLKIPLPSIEKQVKIVEQLDSYQRIIDGAKMVIDNWKPEFKAPNTTETKIGDLFEKVSETINPSKLKGEVEYIGLENIESNTGRLVGKSISNYESIKSSKNVFKKGDILYGKLRPNLNKVWFADRDGVCSTDIIVLRAKQTGFSESYSHYFLQEDFNKEVLKGLKGAQLPRISVDYFLSLKVPNFTKKDLLKIKTTIDEIKLTNTNLRRIIREYEDKIVRVIENLYGED